MSKPDFLRYYATVSDSEWESLPAKTQNALIEMAQQAIEQIETIRQTKLKEREAMKGEKL